MHATRNWKIALCLVTVIALATACTASMAQTLIGSTGAAWQNWNLDKDSNGRFLDLNSNNQPFWDVPLLTFEGYYVNKSPANKSVGWCLTSNGDCQGVGSALVAPGPLPFWGMSYSASSDTGGAIDPKVYFKTNSSGESFQATLYLNSATNTYEIN